MEYIGTIVLLSSVNLYAAQPAAYGVLDCKLNEVGNDYSFTLSTTWSGKTCQRWDAQTPHVHIYTNTTVRFPDQSLSAAENYCRNPSYNTGGPWCYTTDPYDRWEYCSVRRCPAVIYEEAQACRFTTQGSEYSGREFHTASGLTCQTWASQEPHSHYQDLASFPQGVPASNYCRNPDGTPDGPWCYTVNPSVRWLYCDIPYCSQAQWEEVVEEVNIELDQEPEGSAEEPDDDDTQLDQEAENSADEPGDGDPQIDQETEGSAEDSGDGKPDSEERGSECPRGWRFNSQNGHCYLFKSYTAKKRAVAKDRCFAQGGYLVQIEHREELDYLASVSRDISNWSVQYYWTGGVRQARRWAWEVLGEDGEEEYLPMSQDFWDMGYPSNNGSGEDVAILSVYPDSGEVLHDNNCTDKYMYICEKS